MNNDADSKVMVTVATESLWEDEHRAKSATEPSGEVVTKSEDENLQNCENTDGEKSSFETARSCLATVTSDASPSEDDDDEVRSITSSTNNSVIEIPNLENQNDFQKPAWQKKKDKKEMQKVKKALVAKVRSSTPLGSSAPTGFDNSEVSGAEWKGEADGRTNATKRNISQTSNSSLPQGPANKKRQYSAVVQSDKIVVITFDDGARTHLTADDADYVREQLDDLIIEETELFVKIEGYGFNAGRVKLSLENTDSVNWVKSHVPLIPPREGSERLFKAWSMDELPKLTKHTLFVQNKACRNISKFIPQLVRRYGLYPNDVQLYYITVTKNIHEVAIGKTIVMGLSEEAIRTFQCDNMRPYILTGRYDLVDRTKVQPAGAAAAIPDLNLDLDDLDGTRIGDLAITGMEEELEDIKPDMYCILTFKAHIDTLLQSQRKLVTVKNVPVQLFLLEFGDHAQVQDRPAGLNVLLHDRSKDAEYQFKEVVIVWAQGNRHIGQVLYQLRQKFEKRGVNIDTILPYCDTVDDIRNHFVKMITCSVAETMRKSGNTDGYSYEMETIFNPPEPNPMPPGMMQGGPYMQGPYGPPQFFGPAAPHFPQFGPFGGMGGMMGPPPPFQFSLPQLLMELGQNLGVGDMGGNQQPNNQQPNNQQPKKKLYDQPRGCRGGKKNREKKMQERLAKEAADYAAGIVPEKVGGTGANEVSNYLDEPNEGFGKKPWKGQKHGNNQRQNFGQQNKNPYNWKNAGGYGKGNYQQQQNRFGNYNSGFGNYTSGYANNTKKPFKAKVTYTVDNSVSECMADMTFSTQDTPYIPQSSDNKGSGYIHRYDSQVGKGDGKGSSTSFGIGSVNKQNNRTGFEFTKATHDPVPPPPPPAITSSYTPKANTNVTTQNNGNQGRFSSQNTSGQLSGFGQVGSGQAGNSQRGTGSGQSRSAQSAGANGTGSGQSVVGSGQSRIGSGQNLSGQNQTKYGGGAGSGDGQYGSGNAALGASSGQYSGAVGQSSQNYGTSKNTGQYRSGPMTYSAPQTSSGQSSQPKEQHQTGAQHQTAQQYGGQYNSGQQQNSGQYTSGQQQFGQTNSAQSYTTQQNYSSNNSTQQNYGSNYNNQVQQQTGQQNATNYQQSTNTGQYQQPTSQLTSPYQQTQQSSSIAQQSTGQYQQSTGQSTNQSTSQYQQSSGQSTNQSTSQYQQTTGQGQYQASQRANVQQTQQYAQTPTHGTPYNQGTNQTYNTGSTNTSYQPPGAYPTNTNVAQPQTNQQGYQNTSQQYSSAQYGTSTGQAYGTNSQAAQAYNPSTGQYGSTQQYR